MPITGKFGYQLRNTVLQYERRTLSPLPLTDFEYQFQLHAKRPLVRRPGQKLSALLADVPGLELFFPDHQNPHLMYVRTCGTHHHQGGFQNSYQSRHKGKPHAPPHARKYAAPSNRHQQLVVRDNRNPLLLVKLLVDSYGTSGISLGSLEAVFEQKYGRPLMRPAHETLSKFLRKVRGVECYCPRPGNPSMYVRSTSSTTLARLPPQQQQQHFQRRNNFHRQQCVVEEHVTTEIVEEVTGPDVTTPVAVDTIVCVDTSSSMAGHRIKEACAGVGGVCSALANRHCEADALSVLGFGSRVHELQGRQPVNHVNAEHLKSQLSASVGGSTALFDAIARGVVSNKAHAGGSGQEPCCAEVMVLTDGEENASKVSQSELRTLLQAAGKKRRGEDGRSLVHVTLIYVGTSTRGRAQLDQLAEGLEHVTVNAYKDSQGGIAKAFSGFVTAMASRTVRRVKTTKVRRMVNNGGSSASNINVSRKPVRNNNRW